MLNDTSIDTDINTYYKSIDTEFFRYFNITSKDSIYIRVAQEYSLVGYQLGLIVLWEYDYHGLQKRSFPTDNATISHKYALVRDNEVYRLGLHATFCQMPGRYL